MDEALAAWLSESETVIAVRGWGNLGQYDYRVLRGGATVSEENLDPDLARVVSNARENPDHLTKPSYDDLNTFFRHPSRRAHLQLVGFMLP